MIHTVAATAAATCVVTKAFAAAPFAPSADPALNPNHPNHSSPAPRSVNGSAFGRITSRRHPVRGPSTSTSASAAAPALMCTTSPPAKSIASTSSAMIPPPHTQCAIGAYTITDHTAMKTTHEENFIRSATAPAISAGVMIANIIWNTMNALSGTESP